MNTRIAFALALALLACSGLSACESGDTAAFVALAGSTPAAAVTLVD